MRKLICVALASLGLFAKADDVNTFELIASLSSQTHEQAKKVVEELEKEASAGTQASAFTLRYLYALEFLPNGNGAVSGFFNPERSNYWNTKLIEFSKDKYPYEYTGGLNLFKGYGMKPDAKKAAEAFEKVAVYLFSKTDISDADITSQNLSSHLCVSMKAAACLAYCYENGIGVKKDPQKSSEIKAKIASIKNPSYFAEIAEIFSPFFGKDAEFVSDYASARYYTALSKSALDDAKGRVKSSNKTDDEKLERYFQMEIAELEKESDPMARRILAERYISLETVYIYEGRIQYICGIYDTKNAEKGIAILKDASEKGDAMAMMRLAELYLKGNRKGVLRQTINMPLDFNLEAAKRLLAQIIKLDDAFVGSAYRKLGDIALFESDEILSEHKLPAVKAENIDLAMKCYIKATKDAKDIDLNAMESLALLYEGLPMTPEKPFIAPNIKAAFYWKEKEAKFNTYLRIEMAKDFLNGYPVKKDYNKAAEYFLNCINEKAEVIENQNEILAVEAYAAMSEAGMVDVPRGNDFIESMRAKYKISDAWVFDNISRFFSRGELASPKKVDAWRAAKNKFIEAEMAKGSIATEIPKNSDNYELRLHESIKKLEAQANADSGEVQFIIAGVYKHIEAYISRNVRTDANEKLAKSYNVKAKSYFKNAIDKGYEPAIIALAYHAISISGYDFTEDYGVFLKLRDEALKLGNVAALLSMVETGDATKADVEKLLDIIEARPMHERCNMDDIMHSYHKIKDASPKEIFDLFERATKIVRSPAMYLKFAYMNLLGDGCEPNPERAVAIFENLLGTRERAPSVLALAFLYQGNCGVAADLKKQKKYEAMLLAEIAKDKLYVNEYFLKEISMRTDKFDLSINIIYYKNKMADFVNEYESREKDIEYISPKNRYSDFYDISIEELEADVENGKDGAEYALARKYTIFGSIDYEKSASIIKKLYKENPNDIRYILGMYYYTISGLGGTEKNEELANALFEQIISEIINKRGRIEINFSDLIGHGRGNFIRIATKYFSFEHCKRIEEIMQANPESFSDDEFMDLSNLLSEKGDKEKSFAILEKLAERGYAFANIRLADYYQRQGDAEKSFACIKKAWEAKKTDSFYALRYAKALLARKASEGDMKTAFDLFRFAQSENREALIWISYCYENGYGIEKNSEKSKEYLDKAIAFGENAADLRSIGNSLIKGGGYLPNLPEMGYKILLIAAENGDGEACKIMADYFMEGEYEPVNHKKAAEFYIKFAEHRGIRDDFWGYDDALRIYKYSSEAASPDMAFNVAQKWISQNPDSAWALTNLSLLYLYGVGVEKDERKAFELIESAMSKQLTDMRGYLTFAVYAHFYYYGIHVEKNIGKAQEIIRRAMEMEVSRCGVSMPYLNIARNYLAEQNPFEITDYLGFSPDDKMVEYWLGVSEDFAKEHSNKNELWRLRVLESFFKKEAPERMKNPKKADELEEFMQALRNKEN